MKEYKRELQKKILLILGLCIVSCVVTVTLYMADSKEHTFSFMMGLSASFISILIVVIVNYVILVKNPDKMRQKAIKAADERNLLIEQKVQAMSFRIFAILLSIITIILAFYDVETMVLMSKVLWLAMIVQLLVFVYYKRKL